LNPGDIIITGTPEGVSPIVPGDVIVAEVEKIGSMEVKVRAAEAVAALSIPPLVREERSLREGAE
jgi:hypothetical protein